MTQVQHVTILVHSRIIQNLSHQVQFHPQLVRMPWQTPVQKPGYVRKVAVTNSHWTRRYIIYMGPRFKQHNTTNSR